MSDEIEWVKGDYIYFPEELRKAWLDVHVTYKDPYTKQTIDCPDTKDIVQTIAFLARRQGDLQINECRKTIGRIEVAQDVLKKYERRN